MFSRKLKPIFVDNKYLVRLGPQRDGGYMTQLEAAGKDETFISRIRKDNSRDNALNMWVVSDNLLKGAALNTVQIAERLIKDFYGK